jgi:hypothetical protein
MSETRNGDTNNPSGIANTPTIWSVHGGDPYGSRTPAALLPNAPADAASTVNSAPMVSNVSNPGVGVTPPNAGLPISITGASGSTGNPTTDLNRKVVGQVPNGPAFSNPA